MFLIDYPCAKQKMHSEIETMRLPQGAEVIGKEERNIGVRACPSRALFVREFAPHHAHSDAGGYKAQELKRRIVTLAKAGTEADIFIIRRSAVLQCSGDSRYVTSVAAHRSRIAELQRKEALQESVRQQILNRKKQTKA